MTHSLDSLIEFRRKLVKAKEIYCSRAFFFPWYSLECAGISLGGNAEWDQKALPESWWLTSSHEDHVAMFNNSIANVDRMIEELK